VIVRDGAIIGEGWHERAGGPHAEVVALGAADAVDARKVGAGGTASPATNAPHIAQRDAQHDAQRLDVRAARGATAYVTLEPCAHFGRTPPCADALITAGVARVVVAMSDPNPQVAGRGLARLAAAGIAVDHGLCEAEARELNPGFVARMTRGRPWLRLKIAATLDGKTALANGVSQWITGPAARRDAQVWRARSCAILTGSGTVRDDNPRLTVREIDTPRQPLKVIVDSRLETSPQAALFTGIKPGGVLLACAVADPQKHAALTAAGAEIVVLPNAQGQVDLPALLAELGHRGINEVLVEAGVRLNGALLRADLVDELLLYQAPLLLGDAARGMADLGELQALAAARRLEVIERRPVGADFLLRARFL
jgi:diaminohydroxyphosphoribosylaminopyrimidine deaminase/5-amino-6-(5-phosphoribosylamino)uracil reductase